MEHTSNGTVGDLFFENKMYLIFTGFLVCSIGAVKCLL